MLNFHDDAYTVFDCQVSLLWQSLNDPCLERIFYFCDAQFFYFSIPDVARFLVLASQKTIVIDAKEGVTPAMIEIWLSGTVMAYLLQYQGDLVLHGAAVLIEGEAVIVSGVSGMGKSTLAHALTLQGYPLITDDVLVIRKDHLGQLRLIPGPSHVKLWSRSLIYFGKETDHKRPISNKIDKFFVPAVVHQQPVSIRSFYEIKSADHAFVSSILLSKTDALQCLMRNAYRYFMLKSLKKLPVFFGNCASLSRDIRVYEMVRTADFSSIASMIQWIQTYEKGATTCKTCVIS